MVLTQIEFSINHSMKYGKILTKNKQGFVSNKKTKQKAGGREIESTKITKNSQIQKTDHKTHSIIKRCKSYA